jgi:hypothetical protein
MLATWAVGGHDEICLCPLWIGHKMMAWPRLSDNQHATACRRWKADVRRRRLLLKKMNTPLHVFCSSCPCCTSWVYKQHTDALDDPCNCEHIVYVFTTTPATSHTQSFMPMKLSLRSVLTVKALSPSEMPYTQ